MSDQHSNDPVSQANPYAAPSTRVDDVVPEGEIMLADRGTRLAAAIIDGIIVFIFQMAMAFTMGVSVMDPNNSWMTMLPLQLGTMGFYVAINYYLLAKNGQSIGKKLMSIKIVRTDGSKALVGRIIGMRLVPVWVVSIIPIFGGIVALVDALFIFRESRKCLHDNIADTIVVKV